MSLQFFQLDPSLNFSSPESTIVSLFTKPDIDNYLCDFTTMWKLMNLLHWLAVWISRFVIPPRAVNRDTYFPASGSHNSGNVKNLTLESIRKTIQAAHGGGLPIYVPRCAIFCSVRGYCRLFQSHKPPETATSCGIFCSIGEYCRLFQSNTPPDTATRLRGALKLTGRPTEAQTDSCEDFKIWGTKQLLTWFVGVVLDGFDKGKAGPRWCVSQVQPNPRF